MKLLLCRPIASDRTAGTCGFSPNGVGELAIDYDEAGNARRYVWWQGNWDIQNGALSSSLYETNLTRLINQLRAYYADRYPGKCSTNTPFVLVTGCGDPQTSGNGLVVANAQLAVSDPAKHPEFAGNVKTMDTRGYWRDASISPGTAGYHYNMNAETCMLTGDALGRGMISLLSAAADANRPVFRSYGPRSGASFPLSFSGPGGQSYHVLSSTNVALPLSSWKTQSSGTFGVGGPTSTNYTDTSATNQQRFYRIKSP